MTIKKHSHYEYEVKKVIVQDGDIVKLGFIYQIYNPECKPSDATVLIDSSEYFETDQEADFAAIGHISLLENEVG